MLFKIEGKRTILNHEYYRVSLNTYKDGQASPDVFNDFETDVPITCKREDGGEAYIINERSFLRIMLYWVDEVNDFNNDRFSEQFGDRLEQQQIGVYDLMVQAIE